MNREDLMRITREAGMQANISKDAVNALGNSVPVQWLERFAELVAVVEREACAKLVEETKEWRGKGWFSTLCPKTKDAIAEAIRARNLS